MVFVLFHSETGEHHLDLANGYLGGGLEMAGVGIIAAELTLERSPGDRLLRLPRSVHGIRLIGCPCIKVEGERGLF